MAPALLGAPVGAGATATFSLYATKNITCGEGGLITTDDDEIAARLRLLRNHGMRASYDFAMPGSNYRLTAPSAASCRRSGNLRLETRKILIGITEHLLA